MAITHVVTEANATGSGPSVSKSFASLPTVGNRVIAVVRNGGSDDGTVSDNQGNTWTKHEATPQSFNRISIWSAPVVTSSGTFTVTVTTDGSDCDLVISEYSGILSTAVISSAKTTGTSSAPAPGNTARVESEDFLAIAGAVMAQNGAWTPPTSYTEIMDVTYVAPKSGSFARRIVTAFTKNQNPAFTAPASAAWAAMVVFFANPLVRPTFQAASSTPGAGTADVSPTLPADWKEGDLHLLCVESAGTPGSAPSGWVAVADSPQDEGTNTALEVYWRRAVSGDTAPTVTDRGNHTYAVILGYAAPYPGGDPWDVTSGGTETGPDTSLTAPGDTTTVDNCRVVVIAARSNDASGAGFSAWANADLTSVTERFDNGTTQGDGGGIGVADGIKATAGAFGNTTATVTSSAKAYITLALKPGPGKVTVAGNQPNATGALALKKTLKSLAGNQPNATGTLADITIIPGGVTLTGAQPAPSGTVVSARFKSLAGNQPNATGTVAYDLKLVHKTLTGAQPAPSGTVAFDILFRQVTLAGNQPNATGTIAALRTAFAALAGNQPAASGALAFDIILRHITLAGNQPAGSGTIAAVRAKFISLAGNQPNATGALVALFKNKLLQGAQAAPSGSIAFDRLLSHITLAGNQPAASGAIAAVSATFVDLAGNQPAASGALVALFTSKLLQGNQPNATGVLAALHLAFVALAGDQPAGSGTIVGVAPIRNYTPSPYGGSARATLQPPGASGRVTDVRPGPGSVRTNNPPNRGSARFTP